MDEQLQYLIDLQEVDRRIRACADEKERVPLALVELERRREAVVQDLGAVRDSVEAAQKMKRDRDRDLEVGSQKIEKLKARTSEIKTNKEYQALLKEIEAAEQENRAIEDDILALMEKADAAGGRIKDAEREAAAAESAIAEERKRLDDAMARLDGDLAELRRTRQETAARIAPAVSAEYEKLIATKGGKVVVRASNESCSGCYMSIPPQLFVNVKKNETINACPHCGRILYFKE